MFDNAITVAVWLVAVVGGGSLWLNRIARDGVPNPATRVRSRAGDPTVRGEGPEMDEGSSADPRAALATIRTDRQR